MKSRDLFSLAALTVAVVLSTSCTPRQEGAAIGGAIGSVAGGAITDSGTGAAVGGLLGAAVGAAVADDRRYRRGYYPRGNYRHGYDRGGYYPRRGYHAPPRRHSRGFYY